MRSDLSLNNGPRWDVGLHKRVRNVMAVDTVERKF